MNFLLDTHIFLWWILDKSSLSNNASTIISDMQNNIYLSVASVWEMIIKSKLGKLDLIDTSSNFIKTQIEINSINILNINIDHSLEIYSLPEIHKDPFDRMLIAQARTENLTIITKDALIKKYDVSTIW